MLYSGTDPESYDTEYTLVYEDKFHLLIVWKPNVGGGVPPDGSGFRGCDGLGRFRFQGLRFRFQGLRHYPV